MLLSWFATVAIAGSPSAERQLVVMPEAVALTPAAWEHQLIISYRAGKQFFGDLTRDAKWSIGDANVATVSDDGVITAVANGETTITAEINGQSITAKVNVSGFDAPGSWSFRNHVQPILAKYGCNSGACHGAAAGKNGFRLSLRGYDADFDYHAVTRQARGRRVVRSEPTRSLLLTKPTATVKHAGGERFGLNSVEYKVLLEWIASGSEGPSEADPQIERIEMMPSAAVHKVGDEQQMVVQAYYSNGDVRDVTRWVKFSTSEDGVAKVDANGRVSVVGAGEAAINAWFDSQVFTSSIGAPFEQDIDPKVYADSPRNNFIDEHVLTKLASLNIPVSGQATDREFIRRAYLDAAGILPTPEDVETFVADADADKRAKLIDRLVQRDEFTDYWAYKLSDLLLVSSRHLKEKAALVSFYRFIRESVAANKPWDQFVREIITAQGSNLDNGAVNYFLIHKNTTELTETTSVAFLGLAIGCAKCHNHPLEKWTQNDYYGMANLLSRAKIKDGSRGGEVLLASAKTGNINHLNTGQPMPPKPLDADPIPLDSPRDRRAYLAEWLTAPENPYFTRAFINRIWKNFMGTGLAEPADDMRMTNPVSNKPLMDALEEHVVDTGYDLRGLIRTIMTSAAYQRSASPVSGNETDDKYYSRYIIRRLPAEVLLDAYSQVTGIVTNFPGYPAGWRAMQLPDSEIASYFLDTFGRPERKQTCACERTEAASITQALHVSNGNTLNDKLRAKGGRIDELIEAKTSDEALVETLYAHAMGREPKAAERSTAIGLLREPAPPDTDATDVRRERIEDIFWALLTSKEFTFNH